MSVELAPGTALADALNTAIQSKIAELGWGGDGLDGTQLSEYIILLLTSGKTRQEIASEVAGDLLGSSDDQGASSFAEWLFEQYQALSEQFNPMNPPSADAQNAADSTQDESMGGSYDSSMDAMTDAPSGEFNAPTGPKAMRGGAGAPRGVGRERRMVGQINRHMDRTHDSVLHRVRGQSGNERIGRAPPSGPRMGVGRQPRVANARANNIAAGLANMGGFPGGPAGMGSMGAMNGMNGMNNMNGMEGMDPAAMGGMNGMNPGGFSTEQMFAMMAEQNRMMQQMQQQLMMQQGGMGHNNGHGRGNGRSLFERTSRPNGFRRGGAQHQHNGHGQQQQQQPPSEPSQAEGEPQGEDIEMGQTKREAPNPEETVCRFNLRCQNKDCKFAHQSLAAPPGITIDPKDVCTFGVACKNKKCVGRHPSPATKMAHQSEMDCKFFPNCTNPKCPFRHPSMPACRNGGECKVPNCQFTHVKTPCRFRPCTNRYCPFSHEEGQRGTFQDKVWVAGESKENVSERKFVDENAAEELVLPGSGAEEQNGQDAGLPEVVV